MKTNQAQAPDVSIIIVNWNSATMLRRCLSSILATENGPTTEVWVVDNNSSDDSVSMVRATFPHVRLIANTQNRGFAAANNQAAALCAGRYLLLLNPDTEVFPNTLSALYEYAEASPTVGAIGPRLLHTTGAVQRSWWLGYPGPWSALAEALYLWKLWRPRGDNSLSPIPRDVDHLLGACMLIRRLAWQEVGAFDEGFFIFLEETDWCYRAKQAGWRIVFHPGISAMHHGQHSVHQIPQRTIPLYYRNYCRFFRKHHPLPGFRLIWIKGCIIGGTVIRLGLWLSRLQRAHEPASKAQVAAMLAGYRQVLREVRQY